MQKIMLDLETLGTGANSVIIAIGAVKFDSTGIKDKFYRVIDPASCVKVGMQMDVSTVMWWMKQSDKARAEFERPNVSIQRALIDFAEFVGFSERKNTEVWGNGASFDNVLLANAYKKCEIEQPWNYVNDRCYRTIKGMNRSIPLVRTGTYHNALNDAETQALHLILILNELDHA